MKLSGLSWLAGAAAAVVLSGCSSGPALYVEIQKSRGDMAQAVPLGTSFATGDQMRVVIRSRMAGDLYILSKGTSGSVTLLYPLPDVGPSRIGAKAEIVLPPTGVKPFTFFGEPGTEFLCLVFAPSPVTELMVGPDAIMGALEKVRQRAASGRTKVAVDKEGTGFVITARGAELLYYEIPIQHVDPGQ